MNIDLVETNIRVSSVDPGAVKTELSVVRFHGDEERASRVYEGFTPLSAEDVADAVCYVANVPPHVNGFDVVMRGTDQRSVTVINKVGG